MNAIELFKTLGKNVSNNNGHVEIYDEYLTSQKRPREPFTYDIKMTYVEANRYLSETFPDLFDYLYTNQTIYSFQTDRGSHRINTDDHMNLLGLRRLSCYLPSLSLNRLWLESLNEQLQPLLTVALNLIRRFPLQTSGMVFPHHLSVLPHQLGLDLLIGGWKHHESCVLLLNKSELLKGYSAHMYPHPNELKKYLEQQLEFFNDRS